MLFNVTRGSVSAAALHRFQQKVRDVKKCRAEYSNLICNISLGWLISLASLKGAKYFQLRPEGISDGQQFL